MQINFIGTHFINARLTQRVFSVWPVAQPVVGEIEMHSVAPFSDFFTFKKVPKTDLFPLQKSSLWELPVLPR